MNYIRFWILSIVFLFSTTIYLPTVVNNATVRSGRPATPTATIAPTATPFATSPATATPSPTPTDPAGGTIPDLPGTPTASPTPEVNGVLNLLVQVDEVPGCFALGSSDIFTPTVTAGWGASVLYESNCSASQPYDSVYQRVQLYYADADAESAYDMLRAQYAAQHEVVSWVLGGFNETFGYATQSGSGAYWYFTVSRVDDTLVTTGLLYPTSSTAIRNPTWNFFYTGLVLEHRDE